MCSALAPGDRVAATYRGHGAALAMGTDAAQRSPPSCMGRSTGVCGGRAGSMNVVDLEHGLIGCFGIVGGSIAAATGAALALQRTGGVAVAFFGDGAVNHGYFHECLNFARVRRLPVVFVCENNLYGEFTPMASRDRRRRHPRPRRARYDMPAEKVDGNDVERSRAAARRGRRATLAAARGPRSSSASPTATSATPRPTPPRTGPRGARRVDRARSARVRGRPAGRRAASPRTEIEAADARRPRAEVERRRVAAAGRRSLPGARGRRAEYAR